LTVTRVSRDRVEHVGADMPMCEGQFVDDQGCRLSMAMAIPIPPPMHSAAIP
jgi:hypothetical protein